MPARNPSDARPKRPDRHGDTPPIAEVPESAKRDLRRGTIAAVVAAEAMSTVRLYDLGRRIGLQPGLAWLLPAALDIYALTMLRFSSRVPDSHPLRRKAGREATLALLLTVGCNALFEVIVAFGGQLPSWAPGALFVLVCALPPLIAGRMIHFQALITPHDTRVAVVDDVPTVSLPSPRHAADRVRSAPLNTDTAAADTVAAPSTQAPDDTAPGTERPVSIVPLNIESDHMALLAAEPPAWDTVSKAEAVRKVDELLPGRTASQVVHLLASVGVTVDNVYVRKTRQRARQADTAMLATAQAERGA